jgi:hypothetical protein
MRRFSLAVLLLGLMAAPLMEAQTAGKDSYRQQGASTKGVNLAGKVSKDGKTLLADDDNVWSVSNAGKLQGFEGRNVTVKCQTDPDKRAIHVLSVVDPSQDHFPANSKDSAFRK